MNKDFFYFFLLEAREQLERCKKSNGIWSMLFGEQSGY